AAGSPSPEAVPTTFMDPSMPAAKLIRLISSIPAIFAITLLRSAFWGRKSTSICVVFRRLAPILAKFILRCAQGGATMSGFGRWFIASLLVILSAASTPALPITVPRPWELDRLNAELKGHVVDFTHNHGVDNRMWSPALGKKRDMYVYL